MKKLIYSLVIILISLILYLVSSSQSTQTDPSLSPSITPTSHTSTLGTSTQSVKVTRVVDGDTIEIEGGRTVRYIGMDTPETVKPNTPVQCFGKEASTKNKELVEGKEVRLEKDVSETDRYGRLLRYVYVDGIMVNKYLVENGFAHVATFPPDVKYQDIFLQAQKKAQSENKGLWSSCPISITPTKVSNQTQTNSCSVKGNINADGKKIYHLPSCPSYANTQINTSKGEKYFCTEAEAQAAGFTKASNCP